MWRTIAAVHAVALALACAPARETRSACDGLPRYPDTGLPRQVFLPCAAEMAAALDLVRLDLEAALSGERQAFDRAGRKLREVDALRAKAGGRAKLLSRWDDRALNDVNLDIENSYNLFHGVWQMNSYYGRGAAASVLREKSRPDVESGRQHLESAKRTLARLR